MRTRVAAYYVAMPVKMADMPGIEKSGTSDPVGRYKKVAAPTEALQLVRDHGIGARASVIECEK